MIHAASNPRTRRRGVSRVKLYLDDYHACLMFLENYLLIPFVQ